MIKAVLLGLLVDMGGSALASFLAGMVYSFRLYSMGLQDDAFSQALRQIYYDSGFVVFSLIVGTVSSALGGYVCGRVARHAGRRPGQVLAGLVLLYGWASSIDIYPVSVLIGLSLCTWAAVTTGVALGMKSSDPAQN